MKINCIFKNSISFLKSMSNSFILRMIFENLFKKQELCLFRNESHSYREGDYFRNPVITYLEVPSRFPLQKKDNWKLNLLQAIKCLSDRCSPGISLPSGFSRIARGKYRWGNCRIADQVASLNFSAGQN